MNSLRASSRSEGLLPLHHQSKSLLGFAVHAHLMVLPPVSHHQTRFVPLAQ